VYSALSWTPSQVHGSHLRPNQTLVSYSLAGLAELSRLSSISLKTPASDSTEHDEKPRVSPLSSAERGLVNFLTKSPASV
jgi:hypothetical protein